MSLGYSPVHISSSSRLTIIVPLSSGVEVLLYFCLYQMTMVLMATPTQPTTTTTAQLPTPSPSSLTPSESTIGEGGAGVTVGVAEGTVGVAGEAVGVAGVTVRVAVCAHWMTPLAAIAHTIFQPVWSACTCLH